MRLSRLYKIHTQEIEKGEVSPTISRASVIKPNINLPKLVTKSSVVIRSCGNSFMVHSKPLSTEMRI